MSMPEAVQWLRGRDAECDALDQLLKKARSGQSQVLVLAGEAGIGKTALLQHLLARASGCRVASSAGVESEMELAYAGLQQLCSPFLGLIAHLPGPQRDALDTAFGVKSGSVPDRFLVGLAVLSLLSDVAEKQPLICVIDDAQWLDVASVHTLTFVARRLLAEPIAVVFAMRDVGPDHGLRQLGDLMVEGLGNTEARSLLDSVLTGPLEQPVRDRIVAEAHGNPLALLELPRGLTSADLAFGAAGPGSMPVAQRLERDFLQRLDALPAETRLLLVVAAAEPIGDVTLLWRAAEHLGIETQAAAAAAAAGLIDRDTGVRFRHPLVRSAAYRAATPEERASAHRALALATDPDQDPDRRAWHRAQATRIPDETVAAELEHSATRARSRGGLAAAAAFLERSARLTPGAHQRARRALAAAELKLLAGAFDSARVLLSISESGQVDDLARARIELLRAHIAFASSRGGDAIPLLLAAAARFEPLDVSLARETYLDALSAGLFAGRLAGGVGAPQVAAAARRAPPPVAQRNSDLLLDALAMLFTDGYPAAVPLARRAVQAFRSERLSDEDGLRWLWLASIIAADIWDDESWNILSARHVQIARDTGALSELPLALNSRVYMRLFSGELPSAAVLVEELQAVQHITGTHLAPFGALGLAGWRGRAEFADALIAASMSEVVPRGEGIGVTVTQWASAVLNNGLGNHSDALTAARQAAAYPLELAVANWGLTELIEAAARTGETELANAALTHLGVMTQASGTDWALGIEARSRALLAGSEAAEPLYREAIDRLTRTSVRLELARAELVYGEWLRRDGQRVRAREHLRIALEMFTAAGAEGFAERSRRELVATGEKVRKRTADNGVELTAQELQVARLAGDGRTNPEIGAQLFLSPRTVEWHLGNVFTKLGLSSRKELPGVLIKPARVAVHS
jgi:DNA-binding CsgD family transcriptional regulator